MSTQDTVDPAFDGMTSRLLRREALRRSAEALSTMTGPGLENALAQISAEATEEAVYRRATAGGGPPGAQPPGQA
jgi:phage shock protein A